MLSSRNPESRILAAVVAAGVLTTPARLTCARDRLRIAVGRRLYRLLLSR